MLIKNLNGLLAVVLLLNIVGCATTFTRYKVTSDQVIWAEDKPSYKKINNYNKTNMVNYPIVGADPKTFKVLEEYYYGKDENTVYYRGYPIAFADSASFKVVSESIATDKNYVFRFDQKLEGISPQSIEVIKDNGINSYIRQDDIAFYNAESFKLCDAISFHLLKKSGWAVDNECAYYDNFSFTPSDISSFTPIDYSYAKDDQSVYYKGKVLLEADVSSFELNSRSSIAKDKNNCFMYGELVDCNTKKKIRSYKTKSEIDSEVDKIVGNLIKSNRESIAKAGVLFEQKTEQIIEALGSDVLTPEKKIDPSPLPMHYSFTLKNTAPFGKDITYVKTNSPNELSFNLYEERKRVLTKVTYNKQRHIIEDYDNYFHKKANYVDAKCERQLGICEQKQFIKNQKPVIRKYKISYNGGLWKKEFLELSQGSTEEYRIFDNLGLPVYFASFSNGKLVKEYIKSDFVNLSRTMNSH